MQIPSVRSCKNQDDTENLPPVRPACASEDSASDLTGKVKKTAEGLKTDEYLLK